MKDARTNHRELCKNYYLMSVTKSNIHISFTVVGDTNTSEGDLAFQSLAIIWEQRIYHEQPVVPAPGAEMALA